MRKSEGYASKDGVRVSIDPIIYLFTTTTTTTGKNREVNEDTMLILQYPVM